MTVVVLSEPPSPMIPLVRYTTLCLRKLTKLLKDPEVDGPNLNDSSFTSNSVSVAHTVSRSPELLKT